LKQNTQTEFEPVLAQETDFLAVALTTRPQCLFITLWWLVESQKLGYPDSNNPTPRIRKNPESSPEGPGLDELVRRKCENRNYDNKKCCFLLKESGPGVPPYDHESTLHTTWHKSILL